MTDAEWEAMDRERMERLDRPRKNVTCAAAWSDIIETTRRNRYPKIYSDDMIREAVTAAAAAETLDEAFDKVESILA